MLRNALSHAHLMRLSTERVELALHGSERREQALASRILENPGTWRRWEREHSVLMAGVGAKGIAHQQLLALKQTAFRLIHRKALFEFLRDRDVRGSVRMRVLTHFHPVRSYDDAAVAEHGIYLRAACSYLCSRHIGGDIARDPDFHDPIDRYEELYAEYFEAYCGVFFPSGEAEGAARGALLPLLKQQLDQTRLAILDPAHELPRFRREAELRRRSGDPERLDVRDLRARAAGRTRE